jgi:drug/metabolite transporter (DMT)-like permease
MSASPLIAALLGRMLLGERLTPATALAIAAAFAGIALMFAEDVSGGHLLGDAFAFFVALSFGCNIIILRRHRHLDMVPATFLAGVISAGFALPFAAPLAVAPMDIALLAVMGIFQLGLGLILFTRGTPHLRAAEAGLLTLLETVLAPLWVWIGIGEKPAAMALLGGGIVLAALVFHALAGSTARKPAAADPA